MAPAEIECPECEGAGELGVVGPHSGLVYAWQSCPTCGGSGWIDPAELRERGEGG